jgi:chemotaxis protein MotB
MFAEGSKYPYETTRLLLAKMAPVLRKMPNRIRVTGHTTTGHAYVDTNYSGWELSADRANTTRRILQEFGIGNDRFSEVVGKSDTEPLFPNDPFLAANRRISILLIKEAPPLPTEYKP